MSGIEVKYVVKADNAGKRIQSLKTICPEQHMEHPGCEIRDGLKWCDMDDSKIYHVALPSFLATQKYRKSFRFSDILRERFIGPPDYDCLESHIKKVYNLTAAIEGRITIEYVLDEEEDPESGSSKNSLNIMVAILGLFSATSILSM